MRPFLALLSLLGLFNAGAAMAQHGPVVVELYTSQGCSSCPPADAMLHDLAQRDGVIALSLHVDYWDYIGWKDSFGRPENTARQHAYARAAHSKTVYTPQMVFGGADYIVGSRPMKVFEMLQAHSIKGNPVDVRLTRQGQDVVIQAADAPAGDYIVQLVRYRPEASVAVTRGENAGRTLHYANVVTEWDAVGAWDGEKRLSLRTRAPGDSPIVVIIQQDGHGPILGAAQLR